MRTKYPVLGRRWGALEGIGGVLGGRKVFGCFKKLSGYFWEVILGIVVVFEVVVEVFELSNFCRVVCEMLTCLFLLFWGMF